MSLLSKALERAKGKINEEPVEEIEDPVLVAMQDFENATTPAAKAEAFRAAIELAKS